MNKKEKLMSKIDPYIKIIGVIIVMVILIFGVTQIIIITQNKEPPTPNQTTINKTCELFNMYPAGYSLNYKEQKSYILCKIPYKTLCENE